MPKPADREAAGARPSTRCRIVEFCGGKEVVTNAPSCNQHFAIRQQRRRVSPTRFVELAGKGPSAARRIVKFWPDRLT